MLFRSHLENAKRLYPEKILVVDDSSDKTKELEEICKQYGADFYPNSGYSPCIDDLKIDICKFCRNTKKIINSNMCVDCGKHLLGDIKLTARGFRWAKNNNIDLMIKFSRRFLPLYDWRDELKRIAASTGFPAYSSWEESSRLGFKTEAVAYIVNEWIFSGAVDIMEKQDKIGLTESFIWLLCMKISQMRNINREDKIAFGEHFQDIFPYWKMFENIQTGYGHWFIAGTSRRQLLPWRFWHDTNPPKDYLKRIESFGINEYTEQDFLVA